jgi:hypothetical protein
MSQSADPDFATSKASSSEQGHRHSRSGSFKNEKDPASGAPQAVDCTTLTIKHVPREYTEQALILEIEQIVGKGTFDFFYMPWDHQSDSNCGSAVVNFLNPLNAMMCISGLSRRKFRLVNTQAICEVLPAHVQGLAKNLEYYRDRATSSSGSDAEGQTHGPRVFKQGSEVDFWLAMKEHCPDLVKAKPAVSSADQANSGGRSNDPEICKPREGLLQDQDPPKKSSIWDDVRDDASESQGTSQDSASSASCSTEFSQISDGVMNAFQEKFGC